MSSQFGPFDLVWSYGFELGSTPSWFSNWNERNPDSSQIYTKLNASAPRLHHFGQLPLKDELSGWPASTKIV
jgi:hypothetical protein